MNFGKFETREQVARRLEKPIRDYWADTGPFEYRVAPANEMGDILAELDRLDLVAEAQRTVNGETHRRAIEAENEFRDTVETTSGDCVGVVSGVVRSTYANCQHPAKHRLPGGKPLCGVHFRGVLDAAIHLAKYRAEIAYRGSGARSDAERIVLADQDLRATRENWVK